MAEWIKSLSLRGSVEVVEGKFMLIIPLASGGSEFIKCSQGISKVEGEYLKITIPDWMASKIGLQDGSLVDIDNRNGQLNIDSPLMP